MNECYDPIRELWQRLNVGLEIRLCVLNDVCDLKHILRTKRTLLTAE